MSLLCHSRESGNPAGLRARLKRLPRFREEDREAGFTLVELMVVINVAPATDKAAVTKVEADVATLEQGVEMYRLSKLRYPEAGEGLPALVREGFVKRLPDDPWGNPYQFGVPGRNGAPFEIYSLGADGRKGGEGEDADIGNW